MSSKILLFLCIFFLQSFPLSLAALFFLTGLVIWLYGQASLPKSKVFLCAICFLFFKGAFFLVPNPVVEEGHNIFLPSGKLWAPDSKIPENVRNFMVEQFDEAYPLSTRCDPRLYGCWRSFKVDQKDFAWSAEGLFQDKLYSRQITHIDLNSASSARIGVINSMNYNIIDYATELQRWDLPYYVYLQIPSDFEGSTLTIQGHIFMEKNGRYVKQTYESPTPVLIPPQGLSFYGVEVKQGENLILKLTKTLPLLLYSVLLFFLMIGAPIILLLILFPCPNWGQIRIPVLSVGGFFLSLYILEPTAFINYPVQIGGSDGLVHESYGRKILEAFSQGDILGALRGEESIYYFMPGFRYFKALEKALAGESFMLIACLVSFLGFFIYKALRCCLSEKVSSWLTIAFCFTPIFQQFDLNAPIFEQFGFTGYLYTELVYYGLSEPLAIMLFLAGAYLMVEAYKPLKALHTPSHNLESSGNIKYFSIFQSTIAFSLSAFIRPSYLIPIAFFSAVYFFKAFFNVEKKQDIFRIIGAHMGYACLLIMPLHNWFFGGEFVLTTSAAHHPVNLKVTPADYMSLFQSLLSFDFNSDAIQKVMTHLKDWNGLQEFYRLLPLFYAFYFAFKRNSPLAVRAFSLAAISSHAFLLFYIPVGRYAYLAWMLTFIVFLYACETKIYLYWSKKWGQKKRAKLN